MFFLRFGHTSGPNNTKDILLEKVPTEAASRLCKQHSSVGNLSLSGVMEMVMAPSIFNGSRSPPLSGERVHSQSRE